MRILYISLGVVLLSVFLYFVRGCDKHKDVVNALPVLPAGVKESFIIDPVHNTLSVVTAKGVEKLFLPDRPSRIDLGDNGKPVVHVSQYGTELRPFLGLGLDGDFRAYGGVDFFYYKKLDLGFFISTHERALTSLRMGLNLGYTVYNNLSIKIGLDNKQAVNVILAVKI